MLVTLVGMVIPVTVILFRKISPNPLTGYPFDNEILSVTILGESSALCDAIATGIYGLGLTQGIEKIKSLDGYSAVFITKERNVYVVGDVLFTQETGTDNFIFNYINEANYE